MTIAQHSADQIMRRIIANQHAGRASGIYSICSAHPAVLEASILQAKTDGAVLCIESTSNQVDQFGGYTGMRPADFAEFVQKIAQGAGFAPDGIVLGGDHLGPNAWRKEAAESAMAKARDLVAAYVQAGFTKIHLDTSMRCADDPGDPAAPLDDGIITERAADLCQAAEAAHASMPHQTSPPVYVIGTDVPPPGGAQEEDSGIHITTPASVKRTIETTNAAFPRRGLQGAWERVIAVVVQPGVEYGDGVVHEYDRAKAHSLSRCIEKYDNLVYEAHSTDYQMQEKLKALVEDHFAILKVGPWLTFAFREAVFALAAMEVEWLGDRRGIALSEVRETVEKTMLENPLHWKQHYHGEEAALRFARKYSYSDRSRYYWPQPEITRAVERLFANLTASPVPETLLSQYMPGQYQAFRAGGLSANPRDLVRHKIMEVTRQYAYACGYPA